MHFECGSNVYHGFAAGQCIQSDAGAEPRAQHALGRRAGQVARMAAAGVVGVSMGMGNDRALHRAPGIDIKVAREAVEALGAFDDQVLGVEAETRLERDTFELMTADH